MYLRLKSKIKISCVIYELFLIAYPNICGSKYNWKSPDHPWNTLALSLTLHRQRRNFPYRQLVFTIQPFAFSPLIPLFLPLPLATVSLILPFVFTIAISRVCRRSNICIIGDDIFAVGTGCSLNRDTLSRQITIRCEKNVTRVPSYSSFYFSLSIICLESYFYSYSIRYRFVLFSLLIISQIVLMFDPNKTKFESNELRYIFLWEQRDLL